MAKKVQFTTNQPSASTDYLAADNTWKTMSGGGGSTTWGSITGTLSSQTDLQTALDAKMNIATYDTDVDGVVDSAERIQIVVRNSTGSTLSKGQIVYLSGATGNRPNALLAQANTEATSSKTIGMVMADILNNTDGQIAVNGTLHDLNTNAFNAGDSLWLSATTAGGMVANTPPSEPNHAVFIGYVARAHPTQGRVVLNVQNGYELDELHGVQITSVANNDILKYNSTSGLWENSNALSTKQDTITGAATTVVSSNLTPSRVVVSNGGGKLDVAVTTTTEIGYVNGVTSNIQTQLDNKISSSAIIQNNVLAQALTGAASPTTRYHAVAGTISTLTTAYQVPLSTACNFLNFYFRIYSAQPASGSLVLTLQKNAVDTSLAITIAAGSAIGNYTNTNTVAFAAGDTWQIKIVQNATSGSTNLGGYSFKINGI